MNKRNKKKQAEQVFQEHQSDCFSGRPLNPRVLTPEDPSYPCVEELASVVEKTNCFNIALTGVYGSGKSSVIETYLSTNSSVIKNPLRISLSTFNDDGLKPEDTPEDDHFKQYNADIEYKIVQHILYQSDPQKIKQTRFDRIYHKSTKDIIKLSAWVLLAVVSLIVVFEPSFLHVESVYDTYTMIFGERVGAMVNIAFDLLASAYLLFCLGWIIYKCIGVFLHARLNKVKAKELELDFSKNSSVFNRLLDEIVYYFIANHYDLVVFEDLDRLTNARSLFLKLRELNLLLNESESIKKERFTVKFLYAIRDDVFTKDLRTKCFDYIIPVVPVIDHFNACDYLLKHKKEFVSSMEDDDIQGLGIWIKGFRELNNILNEFSLYKKLVLKNDMAEKELMALIIYKNLFPIDYAAIHEKSGLLYWIFENKKIFIESLIKKQYDRVANLKQLIADNNNQIKNTKKEYLDQIVSDNGITLFYLGDEEYTPQEVLESDKLFETLLSNGFTKYQYHDKINHESGTRSYDIDFKEIDSLLNRGQSYEDSVNPLFSDNMDYQKELNEQLRFIRKKERESMSIVFHSIDAGTTMEMMRQLYKKKKGEEADNVMIEVLHSMIFGGYINEDYPYYMSFYHEGSLLESDFSFLQSVLHGIPKPYDTIVIKPKTVVENIGTNKFNHPSILNFSILDYLLSDRNKSGLLEDFITTAKNNPEFVTAYCNYSENPLPFLLNYYDGCRNPIKPITDIHDDGTRSEMLFWFLYASPLNVSLNSDEKLYIGKNYSLMNNNISRLDIPRLLQFLDNYHISFSRLISPVTDEQIKLLSSIREKNHYTIDYENLRIIIGKDFDVKSFTSILSFNDSDMFEYLIENNLGETIASFPNTSVEEDVDALIPLINQEGVPIEWLNDYISNQVVRFTSLKGIVDSRQHILLINDKVAPSWDVVIDYYKFHIPFDEVLGSFLNLHVNDLKGEKCEGDFNMVESLKKALFCSNTNVNIETFKLLLHCFEGTVSYSDSENLDEEHIVILIENKWIKYETSVVEFVHNLSSDIFYLFVVKYYEDIFADDDLDWDDYESNRMGMMIIKSDLSLDQKILYIDNHSLLDSQDSDVSVYAGLICSLYTSFGRITDNTNFDTLMDSLEYNQDDSSWRDKITLVNMINAHHEYNKEFTKKMISSLGGEYLKLNSLYGRAHFDINKENRQLLYYLKDHRHYVSNIIEEDGQFRVSFLSNEP